MRGVFIAQLMENNLIYWTNTRPSCKIERCHKEKQVTFGEKPWLTLIHKSNAIVRTKNVAFVIAIFAVPHALLFMPLAMLSKRTNPTQRKQY